MKYKLLKDLPGYEAGTVFEKWTGNNHFELNMISADFTAPVNETHRRYFLQYLEHPDFFEPIDDKPEWEVTIGHWELENDLIEVWIKDPKQGPAISEAIRAVLAYIHDPDSKKLARSRIVSTELLEACMAAVEAVQEGRE
jgi:hypothetical protein